MAQTYATLNDIASSRHPGTRASAARSPGDRVACGVQTCRGFLTAEMESSYARSREWLNVALLECRRCHKVVERRSPVQRQCDECRGALNRFRSRDATARARYSVNGA